MSSRILGKRLIATSWLLKVSIFCRESQNITRTAIAAYVVPGSRRHFEETRLFMRRTCSGSRAGEAPSLSSTERLSENSNRRQTAPKQQGNVPRVIENNGHNDNRPRTTPMKYSVVQARQLSPLTSRERRIKSRKENATCQIILHSWPQFLIRLSLYLGV
jgi:hypothetical protein